MCFIFVPLINGLHNCYFFPHWHLWLTFIYDKLRMSMRNSAHIPGTYYIVRRTMQYRNLDSQSIQCLAALGEIKKRKKKNELWIFSRMHCLEVFRHLEEDLVLCMHIVEASPHCFLYIGYEWSAGELVFHSWFACPLSFDPLCSSLRGLGTVLTAILWRGTSCFIVRRCQGVVHKAIIC